MNDKLKMLSQILTILVSLTALGLSYIAERHSDERLQKQLDQTEKIARAQVRPLLLIESLKYTGNKGVILSNKGLGSAIIKSITISRKDKKVNNLRELFSFNGKIKWDDGHRFANTEFLKSGDFIPMCLLTRKHLLEQNMQPNKANEILNSYKAELVGINIEIKYEDVLGNPQQSLLVAFPPEEAKKGE
jgi:hypothetical protein